MEYSVNFGSLSSKKRAAAPNAKFRLALLGDFSGRANAGKSETGAALAKRKPIKVDVDNLDDILARMKLDLTLSLDGGEAIVSVPVGSMDDFHPDQIVENVELFSELRSLRRNLANKATFDRAARTVLSWSGEDALPPLPRKAAGSAVATDRKLSDFARLTGRPGAAEAAEASVADLMRRIVGPLVEPARDARADQLTARVDEALSTAMRRILHHPDFQSAEAVWRGVEFLVRRIETGAKMEILLYDVSAEELAADIAGADDLSNSGLYGLLIEQPALDSGQGAISVAIGLYNFELMPPHAELLGRIALVAAAAGAPFIAGIGPDALKPPMHEQHPLIKESWQALRDLSASVYLGLATPRFLLRTPYGKKTDPIDAFSFEEFTRQGGLSGMLWGHPGLIPALLLAESFGQQGLKMKLGTVMGVRDMPYFVYFDADGDQTALPCTERMYSERQAVGVTNYGVMPLLSLRGRPELRLGSFQSVAGATLAGFWAPAVVTPSSRGAAPAVRPAPVEADAPAGAAGSEAVDLDALLKDLGAAEPEAAEPATAEAEAPEPEAPEPEAPEPEAPAADDLDALLASLNVEPPPPEPDATDVDLDALLASLK